MNKKQMSIINDPKITSIPLFSIRMIECQRLFDLIQQNIQPPQTIITAQILQKFMKRYASSDNLKGKAAYNKLKIQGEQLNEENFKINLASKTQKTKFTNQQSLRQYYQEVRNFLFTDQILQLDEFDSWYADQVKSQQNILVREQFIEAMYRRHIQFVHNMNLYYFQQSIQQISYCLSVIVITTDEDAILKVYNNFSTPSILNILSQFMKSLGIYLQTNQMNEHLPSIQVMAQYQAIIAYFYGAWRFKVLSNKLENSFFLYNQTFQTIVMSFQIKNFLFRKNNLVVICYLAKYVERFTQWLLSDIQRNFVPLLIQIIEKSTEQIMVYSIIFLKYILQNYNKNATKYKTLSQNVQVLNEILRFAAQYLGEFQAFKNIKQCILLACEIIKMGKLTNYQMNSIKQFTQVYRIPVDFQKELLSSTLRILSQALISKDEDLINSIIKDESFLATFHSHFDKKSQFFYEFLHIVYLLSFNNQNFLLEKHIFEKIFQIILSGDSVSYLIGIEILLRLIQRSYNDDQLLETLYVKFQLFQKVIPYFFQKWYQRCDITLVLTNCLAQDSSNQNNQNYFNKHALFSIFKILYGLAVGVSRRNKKYAFSKRLNQQIVDAFKVITQNLFINKAQKLIQIILRQKIVIEDFQGNKLGQGIQFFKLLHIIISEMTFNMENKPIDFLKKIADTKVNYSRNLLTFFKIQQLQIENIAVFMEIQFNYQHNNNDNLFKRNIPHKYELDFIKIYIRKFLANIHNLKQTEIKYFQLKQISKNRVIQHKWQYQGLVKKVVSTGESSIRFQIINVQLRPLRQEINFTNSQIFATQRSGMFNNNPPNFNMSNRSNRMQNQGPKHYNNQATYRAVSPQPYYNNHSPRNYTNRNQSPNFGQGQGQPYNTMRPRK